MSQEVPGEKKMTFPELMTPRLKLSAMTVFDAEALFELYHDEDTAYRILFPAVKTLDGFKEVLRHYQKNYQKKLAIHWKICRKIEPNKIVGWCSLHAINAQNKSAEIGFALYPEFRRQGIVSEAVTKVVTYAFSTHCHTPLYRLGGYVRTDNEPSSALLQSLGFQLEGTLRALSQWDKEPCDIQSLSLLKTDKAAQEITSFRVNRRFRSAGGSR